VSHNTNKKNIQNPQIHKNTQKNTKKHKKIQQIYKYTKNQASTLSQAHPAPAIAECVLCSNSGALGAPPALSAAGSSAWSKAGLPPLPHPSSLH